MTTTPTVWLNQFMANTITADTQIDPVITGLSNGNFLVTWTDTNATAAPSANSDLVGVIFDAVGNVVVSQFQLNNFGTARNERDPVIGARNDGGFVLVYEIPNELSAGTEIIYEIFDADGVEINDGFVENGVDGGATFRDPSLAVADDNSFFVTYERIDGVNEEIVGRKVTAGGTVGALQVLRSDGAAVAADQENPTNPDTVLLSNGNFATVFIENDVNGGVNERTLEVRISTASGTNSTLINNVTLVDGEPDSDPHIAALSGGGFVVVWNEDSEIFGRIYNNAGTPQGAEFVVQNASSDDLLNEPDVIGLEDGGFFVAWDDDNDNTVEGMRFNSSGTVIGGQVTIVSGSGSFSDIELGLTTDGRILVTYDNNNDTFVEILDPRETFIAVESGDGQTTGRQDGSTIAGTGFGDVIFGVGGNDTISGNGGNDSINGGDGIDAITGDSGTDTIRGGAGNDLINGGLSTDSVFGDGGDDTFFVDDGDFFDNVNGGSGTDTLNHTAVTRSGDTFDFAAGEIITTFASGTPTLTSIERYLDGSGGNTIIDSSGGMFINAGGGDDIVRESTSGGLDTFSLGSGTDLLEIRNSGIGGDSFDGGSGVDTVDFSAITYASTVVIDLLAGTVSNGGSSEILTNFENVIGSQGGETINGNDLDNTLSGGDGDDTINGGIGDDSIDAGTGQDIVNAGDGNDSILGLSGNDQLNGEVGQDSISGGFGNDFINGGGGADTIDGDTGNDTIDGGTANDLIFGGNAADVIMGGIGNDILYGEGFTDELYGGDNQDQLFGGGSSDTLYGGNGGDTLSGNNAKDFLYGEGGADRLLGGTENDELFGGAGNDELFGQTGNDFLTGGTGADIFEFRANHGSDRILDFEDGIDLIEFDINSVQSIANLTITNNFAMTGADVNYGTGTIRVDGVLAPDLTSADFIFL